MCNLIADKLLRLPYIDWNGKLKKQYEKDEEAEKEAALLARKNDTSAVHPPTHLLADYTGLYVNKGYGKILIRLSGDSLISTSMLHPVYFCHKNYDMFSSLILYRDGYDTVNVTPIHFLMDDNGAISSLATPLQAGVDPIVFDRISEEQPLTKESLQK